MKTREDELKTELEAAKKEIESLQEELKKTQSKRNYVFALLIWRRCLPIIWISRSFRCNS